MTTTWNATLLEQLTQHWDSQLRPRLDGLTDEEYRWIPAPGPVWTVHAVGAGIDDHGTGEFRCDFSFPEPAPPPVTTIAWRLQHLVVGVFGMRVAAHFGGPGIDYSSHAYAGNAAGGLAQLDDGYRRWVDGVRALGEDGLLRPCGAGEGPYAQEPMATLVLHIHREVLHHGAEIALLRDLYAAQP